MITLPSLFAKLVDTSGRMLTPWNSYFQQFTQAPASAIDITVGISPFAYTVREPGTLSIAGGTITGVTLTRGSVVITLTTTNNLIPVGINDIVTVSYSVLPTLRLLPSLGIAVR